MGVCNSAFGDSHIDVWVKVPERHNSQSNASIS
jgi:hypothetical protein